MELDEQLLIQYWNPIFDLEQLREYSHVEIHKYVQDSAVSVLAKVCFSFLAKAYVKSCPSVHSSQCTEIGKEVCKGSLNIPLVIL